LHAFVATLAKLIEKKIVLSLGFCAPESSFHHGGLFGETYKFKTSYIHDILQGAWKHLGDCPLPKIYLNGHCNFT
jgi:hypothetical protein